MSRLPDAFHQDRALRDAARDVLIADIEYARASISGKAIAGRVAGRIGDGAKDVLDVAKDHASDRQGLIAGLIALLFLWFAREPIAAFLGFGPDEAGEASLDENTDEADNTPETHAPETHAPETHAPATGDPQ